jgi:hypothetical protein
MESRYKTMMKATMMAMILVVLASLTFSALTLSSVTISPDSEQSPKTTDNLNCSWSYVEGGENVLANVTWYNGTQQAFVFYDQVGSNVLNSTYTKKDQIWNCSVVLGNETEASVPMMDSVIIKNSPPSAPFVQKDGANIGNKTQIIEGIEYAFLLNTTDPDTEDILEFSYSSSSGYCSIGQYSGVITCNSTSQPDGIPDRYNFFAFDGTIWIGTFLDINITPVNDMPYFSGGIANKSINEGQTLSHSFIITDEESSSGYIFGVHFNMSSDYGDNRLNITVSGNVFTVKFQDNRVSNYYDVGNKTVFVNACDAADPNMCIQGQFELEVIPVNHPPEISFIPNISAAQNDRFTVEVNATDIDPDTLNFSISPISCPYPGVWNITTTDNSNNGTGLINLTLDNRHIVCSNVTIYVVDSRGASDSQVVGFNISNVNDAPVLNELSHYAMNTQGNTNISKLIAFENVVFVYMVNGTDVDTLIDPYETLEYADNSSGCMDCPILELDSSTGIINQTFTTPGNFSYNITLTDASNNSTSMIMRVEIFSNLFPFFNQTPGNLSVNETDVLFYVINASDPEGTAVTFSDNSSLINITTSDNAGIINHTYSCPDIGNHSVTITIADEAGALNHTSINLEVKPEASPPILPDLGNTTILEELLYARSIAAETIDPDLDCEGDSLTFIPVYVADNVLFMDSSGVISIAPAPMSQGSYLINITVVDSYGLNDTVWWNLTIANRTYAPVIVNITPSGPGLNTSWKNASQFPSNTTWITVVENTTVVFDQNSVDPEENPLSYRWLLDSAEISTEKSISKYWNFTSSGNHTLVFYVSDNVSGTISNTVSFRWNISVQNLNRPPIFTGLLQNVTNLSTTTMWPSYMDPFSDPDGDTLTYSIARYDDPEAQVDALGSAKTTIEFIGNDVRFTPLRIGTEYVIFTATDGYYTLESNIVKINVTALLNTTIEQPTTSSGTTVRKKTVTTPFPIVVVEKQKEDNQIYLDILNPEPAVIYSNNSLRQVISLTNNGNKTLKGIFLSASTNSTTADIRFSTYYVNELLPKETKKTDLLIVDYKIYDNYEILINANVSDPVYKDKAVIYINALAKSRGNQSVSATKITFAEDLLSSNPECLELNEHLKTALGLMEQKDYEGAAKMTDSVIQGCKYLVSQGRLRNEEPGRLYLDLDLINDIPYLKWALGAIVILVIVIAVSTFRLKKDNDSLE